MRSYIGLDIGGTKTFGGLITERGDILRTEEVPSRAKEGNPAIIAALIALVGRLAQRTPFSGIGIGIAGHIDHVRNRIADAGPNFLPDFQRLRVVPVLLRQFHVPVVLENDAKVFTLGEAVFGAGKGFRRVVGVTLGTGIGGAIVQDKQLVHGKNNLAGEIGQMFTRGNTKTWEKIAAGQAFNAHRNKKRESRLLADGFHNILNVLDPDIVVVGGGLAREPKLVAMAAVETRQRLHYEALKHTPIVKSKLLRNAPILGAMLTVRR